MTAEINLRDYLRPGDTVIIGQGTGEPRSLVEALIAQRHDLAPLRVFVGASFSGLFQPEHAGPLEFWGYGGVGRASALTRAGVMSILPVHIGSLPSLILDGRLHVDAVFAQLSEPNGDGQHSLGLVADYLLQAMSRARVTLAEVNPRVPFTFGETLVAAARITATVRDDRPLLAVGMRALLPEDEAIGRLVASVIPDGATVQFGIGGAPEAVLANLGSHRDLGVHSGLMSDAAVELIEAGVVTNARKELDQGITVAGALFGSDRLYRWADRNVQLAMRGLNYTHNPRVLGNFGALYAINSAVEVDLTGQINGELAAGQYVGTVGGQAAFARAAITSESGRSIVALPSTALGGSASRIVARLTDGVTSTPRADADLVVTEHGIADLRGASLHQRMERLIAVADPRHREELQRSL